MIRHFEKRQRRADGGLRAAVLAVALSALALQCSESALAKKRSDEPDPVAIAAVLLDGGDPARALLVLQDVDESAADLDKVRLYTLRGLAALQVQRYPQAAASLEKALAARATADDSEQDPRVLEVYLAFAHFGAGDCAASFAALSRAGDEAEARAQSFLIRGECEKRAQRFGPALSALREGQRRFPDESALLERELLLLAELSLYQELLARAVPFVARASEDEALLVLEAVRARGAHEEATMLGEAIRLRFPSSQRAALALAHAYVEMGRPLAAARLFEEVSFEDPSYAAEAAELYRRAGWRQMAVLAGARSPDPVKKLRQRFGLLLEEERFEEAAALAPRLDRSGLLDDDEVRYALAFAQLRCHRLAAAEGTLKSVDDPAVFRQAAELRRAIASCRQQGWQCR